jgi:hypothetical protein
VSEKLFGWVPPELRTPQMHETHEEAQSFAMPLALSGYREEKGRFPLWAVAKKVNGGRHIPFAWQVTGSCFRKGTRVVLESGAYKPIEEFVGGESVRTHAGRARKVVRPTSRPYTGRMIQAHYHGYDYWPWATADHLFMTPDGWRPLSALAGKGVTTDAGVCRMHDELKSEEVAGETVHCLEVEEDRSFVIDAGLVVHNCVGAGGGNMLRVLARVEIDQGDPEEYQELWWPYTYGQSRHRAGMRSEGEGSLGSTWAQAITQDGIFSVQEATGLPQFRDADGWLQLSKQEELKWSAGGWSKSQYGQLALKHPVGAYAQIKNSDEGKAAIVNGYPLTCASNFGTRGPRLTGDPAVNVAEWDDTWPHQMSVNECWDHPTLGLIFRIQNNWGPGAHPAPTQGEPPGGFYVLAKTFDRICQGREVYAFSKFKGFVVRALDWYV